MRKLFDLESPIMVGLSRLGDWIVLSILTVVCSIPLVTAGAAIKALYASVDRLQQEKEYNVRTYFSEFKKEFKKSTCLWLLLLIMGAVVCICCLFYLLRGNGIMCLIMLIVLLLLHMAAVWIYPIHAKFDNGIKLILHNAVLCAMCYPMRSMAILIMHALPLLIAVFAPHIFVGMGIVWIGIWPGLTAECSLRILSRPFARFSGQVEAK